MKKSDLPNSLESLTGLELSAVSFVRDYVEFHFDGPVLRALANPIAVLPTIEIQFPAPGSRDAMCSFINSPVRIARINEGKRITLSFASGNLVVPLIHTDSVSGEAAHFLSGEQGHMDVYLTAGVA